MLDSRVYVYVRRREVFADRDPMKRSVVFSPRKTLYRTERCASYPCPAAAENARSQAHRPNFREDVRFYHVTVELFRHRLFSMGKLRRRQNPAICAAHGDVSHYPRLSLIYRIVKLL